MKENIGRREGRRKGRMEVNRDTNDAVLIAIVVVLDVTIVAGLLTVVVRLAITAIFLSSHQLEI